MPKNYLGYGLVPPSLKCNHKIWYKFSTLSTFLPITSGDTLQKEVALINSTDCRWLSMPQNLKG